MPPECSVAPKERVNIVYKSHVGEREEDVELPLKLLILGDFTLRPDDTLFEDRRQVSVDKRNFNEVLGKLGLELSFTVRNRLTDGAGDELPVRLRFEALSDFNPETVARRVPEIGRLLDLRAALLALKASLGRNPAFREKIRSVLNDPEARHALKQELGLDA